MCANTCQHMWQAPVHHDTYRFTCLVSWLYDSVVRNGCSFPLELSYTSKHSPGLPSSLSDLMISVPAPAGSTFSAGASSHSKKTQLNLPHAHTGTRFTPTAVRALLSDRLLGRGSRVSVNKFEPPSSESTYTCSGSFSRAFSELPHPLYTIPTCTHTHSYWPKSCREFKREMSLLFPALWTGTFIGQGEETKSFSDQVRGQVSLSSAALQLHLMVETRHRQTVLCSLMLKEQFAQNLKSCHHIQVQTHINFMFT